MRVGRSRRVTRRGSTRASNASHMITTTQRAPAAASRGPIMIVGCRGDGERFGPRPPDRIARSPKGGAIDGHALEDPARRSTPAPAGAPPPRGGAEEGPDGRGRREAGALEVRRHAPILRQQVPRVVVVA